MDALLFDDRIALQNTAFSADCGNCDCGGSGDDCGNCDCSNCDSDCSNCSL